MWQNKRKRSGPTFPELLWILRSFFKVALGSLWITKRLFVKLMLPRAVAKKKWQIVQSVNLLCELCSRRCIMHSHDLSRWSDVPSDIQLFCPKNNQNFHSNVHSKCISICTLICTKNCSFKSKLEYYFIVNMEQHIEVRIWECSPSKIWLKKS